MSSLVVLQDKSYVEDSRQAQGHFLGILCVGFFLEDDKGRHWILADMLAAGDAFRESSLKDSS